MTDLRAAAWLSQHFVTRLAGQDEVDGLDLQAFNLSSNVVEILVLGDADVILEQALHDLLLFLRDSRWVSEFRNGLLEV